MNTITQSFYQEAGRVPTLWELAFIQHVSDFLAKLFYRKCPPIIVQYEKNEMLLYKLAFTHKVRHLDYTVIDDQNLAIFRKRVHGHNL